jgi:hypothetical protein
MGTVSEIPQAGWAYPVSFHRAADVIDILQSVERHLSQ